MTAAPKQAEALRHQSARLRAHCERQHAPRANRDRGVTFIELLVAIVLVGTVVVGVLAALQTTIRSTTVSRDHAKAQQWLQSAVGVLQAYRFEDCVSVATDGPLIQQIYQSEVDDKALPPFGFEGTIEVSVPRVWNGATQTFVEFGEQDTCFDDIQMRQQLITITVKGADSSFSEQVEVVKRGF